MAKQTYGVRYKGRDHKWFMDLDLTRHADKHLHAFATGAHGYEPEVMHVLLRTLRPGDFCVDVGANLGFHTLLMSSLVGKDGMVLAYEPGLNVQEDLKRNLALNSATNVDFDRRPLWCREEVVKFYHNLDSTGGNALWNPGLWQENVKSRDLTDCAVFDATTLDVEVTGCRLIKIDAEGAEQSILEGASMLLEQEHPPFIITELAPFGAKQFGHTNRTLRDYMAQFGYDCFLLSELDWLPALVPPKTEIVHQNGVLCINVLFSTLEAVSEVWSRVPYES